MPLTHHQEHRIIELHERGVTYDAIAADLGIAVCNVFKYMDFYQMYQIGLYETHHRSDFFRLGNQTQHVTEDEIRQRAALIRAANERKRAELQCGGKTEPGGKWYTGSKVSGTAVFRAK